MQGEASECYGPELLVIASTPASEPAAYAHALRQLLGGVLGGIAEAFFFTPQKLQ